MTYSPWADAGARHPDIHIERCDCFPAHGAWVPEERVIFLERGLLRPERSAALAHEIAHVDLGHGVHPVPWFNSRNEAAADLLAARRLVSIRALARAVRVTDSPQAVAEELEVPLHVVRLRVEHLRRAELALLRRLLED